MGSNGLCVADRSTDQLLCDFQSQNGTGQAAFEEIVRRYAGMVYTVCLQVTRDAHDAEDATQAAFLTLALRAKTAQNIKYLGPWLQKVSRRLSLDIMRAKKRRKRREERRGEMIHRMQPDRDPRQGLDRAELADIVRDELHKLPAKYRLPLILHYYGGLRPEEVARELGYKPSTLGVRLHRGRKMLADSLAGRGINLSNAMLGTVLGMVLHQGICDNLIAQTSLAAAGFATNGELPGAIVSARVLGLTRRAATAAVWAKAKAAIATLLLASAALASGTQVVRDLVPFDFDLRRLNPINWLRPLLRSVLPAPQFSAAQPPANILQPEAIDSIAAQSAQSILDAIAPRTPESPRPFDLATLQPEIDASAAAWPASSDAGSLLVLGVSSGEASMSLAQAAKFDAANARPSELVSLYRLSLVDAGTDGLLADPGVAFDASTRSLLHTSGLRRFDSLVLDSLSGTAGIENYVISASAQLATGQLTVGDAGRGSVRQLGGNVQVSGDLILGGQPTGIGSYRLDGPAARLTAGNEYVGYAGMGQVRQTGGINRARAINLGHRPTGRGAYRMEGGLVETQQLNIGVSGTGQVTQSGGEVVVAAAPELASPPGTVALGINPEGQGTYEISGGTLRADTVVIGKAGVGQVVQTGGTINTQHIALGAQASAVGTLKMTGGSVELRPGGSITVGDAGTGILVAGDAYGGANIYEQAPQGGAALTVRAEPGGHGVVRGSGNISVTGDIVQNGRIIADGHDWPRELDMSQARRIVNTIDNPEESGSNGWFASNGGKLVLPPIDVTDSQTQTWGEDPSDPVPDLVNSVRFTVRDVSSPGKAVLSLLAADHIMMPQYPPDQRFIGVWSFDRKGLQFQNTELRIRYDDVTVQMLGGDESLLQLWTYDEGWQLVSADMTTIDPALNLLDAIVGGDFRLFGVSLPEQMMYGGVMPVLESSIQGSALSALDAAPAPDVSIPEPGSALLAAAVTGVLLSRRRR